ncbi:MAG: DUF5668 domain-containing protein [Dehalococcoidia bacterium]|nr:DUF5668 domain-containing protein [Dehalococcoidia bacterium]
MSGKQSAHVASGFPVFAALLIVAGVLLLLWNFNVLPQGMWHSIAKFWPVVLLIIGVNIFLREKPWLAGFIVLLIMLATVGAAWYISFYYPDALAMALR